MPCRDYYCPLSGSEQFSQATKKKKNRRRKRERKEEKERERENMERKEYGVCS